MKTICGIELNKFSQKPTLEELASIVANLGSEEQAHFFIFLGQKMNEVCGDNYVFQLQWLSDALLSKEEVSGVNYGSQLIDELYQRVIPEQGREVKE